MSNGQSQCSCCKALWVKFRLTTPLVCQDPQEPKGKYAWARVCVVDGERQFWQGEDPDPTDPQGLGFKVWNLECSNCEPPYVFQGEVGDVGLACLDDSDLTEDRYRIVHLWRTSERVLMVKAIDYVKPGEAGKTAQPMKWDSSTKCWEEDTSKSAVTIFDCNKWLLALPGECFKVERTSCCEGGAGGGEYYSPSFPYGLTRRVKITSEIQCGYCGDVTIMQGSDGCLNQESEYKIEACNTSGRKLGCDADEYATFHAVPGECGGDPPTCYGWLVPNARPLRAKAALTQKLCGGDANLGSGSVEYLDVCPWDVREGSEPTTAKNPYGLYACLGTEVELAWNDADCGWDVVAVADVVLPDWVLDIRCRSSGCEVEKKYERYPFYGHFCECELRDQDWDATSLAGTERSVVTGAGCTGDCGFQLTTTKICDFCGSGDAGDPVSVPSGEIEVITGLTLKAGSSSDGDPEDCDQAVGLELKLTGTTKKICAICPSGGGGTFTTGDDVPLNFKLTRVSAATDIDFQCTDCPSLDWCKTPFWAFCVGDEETGGSQECTCVDCEETSS